VRRWELAGQDPDDAFRGLRIVDSEAQSLAALPLGGNWGQTVSLPANEAQVFDKAMDESLLQAGALAREARDHGSVSRLEHLAQAFSLDRLDLDVFLLCLAPALDLRYERLYGYLQNDVTRRKPRVNLVLDLLGQAGPSRWQHLARFANDAPLFRHHLLEWASLSGSENPPLLARALQVDQTVVSWLLGSYKPQGALAASSTLKMRTKEDVERKRGGQDLAELVQAVQAERPVLAFYGPDLARQQSTARWLAAKAQRPLLIVDIAATIQAGFSPDFSLRLALRDALLTGSIPYLIGWHTIFETEKSVSPPVGLLEELCAFPDTVIVSSLKLWQAQGIERERHLFWYEFPMLAYPQRFDLWTESLGEEAGIEPSVVTNLASQFLLTSGQIRDAIASARDMAAQGNEPLAGRHLFSAARTHSNPHLAGLARKIEPRYDWDDIVLPEDQIVQLGEIVATVRARPQVLEQWGVGVKLVSSAGITILFAGPPGTGKTMAAEVIAAELGLDLYKIDLSTVVSKYIGETEKNLERIFHEAQSSNAILFFDEADAIFGKRSEVKDAHDRYANIEVSYLLQRMEAYDGVTILATNLRANLDEAFTRRLQFAVDFPFPEEEDRRRIWRTLFPPDVPRSEEIDFDLLARRFKLAGGSIRNIIVSAAYLAAADGELVTMELLLHGTRRELQKMGRLVN
jgi:AAA+ superfamily predicted ATPase